jgi:hypothetical protein
MDQTKSPVTPTKKLELVTPKGSLFGKGGYLRSESILPKNLQNLFKLDNRSGNDFYDESASLIYKYITHHSPINRVIIRFLIIIVMHVALILLFFYVLYLVATDPSANIYRRVMSISKLVFAEKELGLLPLNQKSLPPLSSGGTENKGFMMEIVNFMIQASMEKIKSIEDMIDSIYRFFKLVEYTGYKVYFGACVLLLAYKYQKFYRTGNVKSDFGRIIFAIECVCLFFSVIIFMALFKMTDFATRSRSTHFMVVVTYIASCPLIAKRIYSAVTNSLMYPTELETKFFFKLTRKVFEGEEEKLEQKDMDLFVKNLKGLCNVAQNPQTRSAAASGVQSYRITPSPDVCRERRKQKSSILHLIHEPGLKVEGNFIQKFCFGVTEFFIKVFDALFVRSKQATLVTTPFRNEGEDVGVGVDVSEDEEEESKRYDTRTLLTSTSTPKKRGQV